jgi:hypothetical protein
MKLIARLLCALILAGCVHDDQLRAPDAYDRPPNGAM